MHLDSTVTDHALMSRIAQKDAAAYRQLVQRHLNVCVRFAERMLANHQDAEDVTQEVCLKIWNEAPRWQPRARFTTWLYRVMFNACCDYRRKVIPFAATGLEAISDTSPAQDEALITRQQSLRVQAALQRLNPRQRAALVLSYYENIANQEAADTLGLQLGAFQQLLYRARQTLKEDLGESQLEQKNG
jgi:RNA polymerase sigma-70 factor (ECF subfamily)